MNLSSLLVNPGVRELPVASGDMEVAVNREVVPTLRKVRENFNLLVFGLSSVALVAGTTPVEFGPIVFSNSPTVTFGATGSTVTAEVATYGPLTVSAGGSSVGLSSLVFSNSNGVTFGLNGSTITASHNGLTSQSSQAASAANGSFTFQTLSFSNAGGVSFSTSAGPAIIGFHNGLTSQSGQALSAANGSFPFQTASFSNANGISFSTAAGSAIVASHNGITSQSNQVLTLLAASNTTQGTSGTVNASNVIFAGAGAASVGVTNGSVVVSVPVALTSQSNQAASASNGSFTFQTIGFSNANNVTFGTSAGGIVTASVAAAGGFTRSKFNPWIEAVAAIGQIGNASLHFHPVPDNENFQFDRVCFDVFGSQSTETNSSGTLTVSVWIGLYTRNVSTLSLFASSSTSQAMIKSGTVQSASWRGPKLFTMGWTTTISQNDYWMGFVSRTTSGGANLNTLSQYLASDINSDYSGVFGANNTATAQNALGLGFYSATTSGIPNSVAFSQITGNTSAALRNPLYYFLSQTA